MFHNSQQFGGKKARWNFGMETRMSDKRVNYSHEPTQTKQQVGWWVVGALLVHKLTTCKHIFTTFITAQTWGS
jgi:hypothetical protein